MSTLSELKNRGLADALIVCCDGLKGLPDAILVTWPEATDEPLFPTIRGRRLSRDALERRLAVHLAHARDQQPSLKTKNVTLHTLRHTAAMQLLHAGIDSTVIALWLGHERVETTQIYLHADLQLKEKALARTRRASRVPRSALSMPTTTQPIRPPPKGIANDIGITGRSA